MKDNWEKHKTRTELTEGTIKEIIGRFNPDLVVDSFHLLTGGLSHTNYKVILKNQPEPLVIRMTGNHDTLHMEYTLHRFLLKSTDIPVPEFHFITEWKNYSIGILEWKQGTLLKERLLKGDAEENYSLGYSAGHHLTSFQEMSFDQTGFLDQDLRVMESFQLTPDSFMAYIHYFVKGKAAQWLDNGLADNLITFSETHAPLFSEDDSKPALVHADYNGLNILVENGAISAILDWEFALSGSIYMDIGNMLRYDYLPHYQTFEKGFMNGIQQGGIQLTDHWRKLAKLTDLISLLSMLDNDFGGTNRVKDINQLITRTITKW